MHLACKLCLTTVIGCALALGLYAQHGTGHAAAAGSVPAPAYQKSAPPARAAQPGLNLGGQPYPVRTDIPTPVGLNAPAAAYTGILPGALKPINGYPSRHKGVFPGLIAAPLFLPSYFDTSISTFPGYDATLPPPVDPNAQALAESQEALAQQIQQLTTEVQQMKNNGPQQPQQQLPPVASDAPAQRPSTPPVTLVLRDGRQISVESYAIMNQTFWNFSKRPVQKIPLSSIDVAASAKATEANGGEFPQIDSAQ